jgi:CTP synthase (UTP-ammonia lyase)
VGQEAAVRLLPGTKAAELYGADTADEDYFCNYGLNPEYRPRLETEGLCVSGIDDEGEVRVVELAGHPLLRRDALLLPDPVVQRTPSPAGRRVRRGGRSI